MYRIFKNRFINFILMIVIIIISAYFDTAQITQPINSIVDGFITHIEDLQDVLPCRGRHGIESRLVRKVGDGLALVLHGNQRHEDVLHRLAVGAVLQDSGHGISLPHRRGDESD